MEKGHSGFKFVDGLDHPLSLKNLGLHAVDGALCADPPYNGKKHGKKHGKRHPGFKFVDVLNHPLNLKNLELHAVDGTRCADPPYNGN